MTVTLPNVCFSHYLAEVSDFIDDDACVEQLESLRRLESTVATRFFLTFGVISFLLFHLNPYFHL